MVEQTKTPVIQTTTAKLLFLGDIKVGKTYIINRFIYDSFNTNYEPTLGIDFYSKTLRLEDKTVKLQIWEIGGQEKLRSLIPNYIRDSSMVVVVFDVTNKQSFYNCDKWVETIRCDRGSEVVIVILGNQIDEAEERVVSVDEAVAKAASLEVMYFETSANTGENIELFFNQVDTILYGNKLEFNGVDGRIGNIVKNDH